MQFDKHSQLDAFQEACSLQCIGVPPLTQNAYFVPFDIEINFAVGHSQSAPDVFLQSSLLSILLRMYLL
jgi:hypothetical protein